MLKKRKSINIVGVLSLVLLAITAPAFGAVTTKQLAAPNSISVNFLNDTTSNNVRVTWSNVTNNNGYTVRIYATPNFDKLVTTREVASGAAREAIFSFPFNAQYRATVQTKGTGIYSKSPESGKYSFNTNFKAVITTQPDGAVNRVALTAQPIVRIAYPSNNTVTSFTGNVVASIASGSGTLTGTKTKAAVAGIAAFTDLVITGTAGNFTLTFKPVGASAAISDPFALTAGAASTIAINAGNTQSATAGTAVSIAPSVIVKDANSNPVSGVSVTFAVVTGGGSLAASGDVTTGVDGIATSPAWTLGTSAGSNTLSATSGSLTNSPLTFTATATAGAASTIAINAGNTQSATAGTAVSIAPSVIVKDANSNPVSGVSVTFAVVTGGGSLAASGDVTTGVDGIATSPAWTLGTSAGSNTLSATSGSLTNSPLTFTATATAGAASTIAINAGNTQSATAGTAVSIAPSVIVKDANSNPVSGVSVTFAVVTGGGSLAASGDVTTGVDGIATSPAWTLGTSAGSNTLSATSGSLTNSPLTFTATATASAPSSLITTGQFTIRFWVKPTAGFLSGGRKELVSLVTDNGVNRFDIWYSPTEGSDWAIYNNQTSPAFLNGFTDLDSPAPAIGNWYEVVVTRDAGNKIHFYFDSVESSFQPMSTVDLTTYKNILIGADPASWLNPGASGQGDAFISDLQIINGVALPAGTLFSGSTPGTTFVLKDFIGSNNSLVLTPTSYFAYSNGALTPRPTDGVPALSTESPTGGGTIFYYSAAGFSCGAITVDGVTTPKPVSTCHYLEVAPNGWSGISDLNRKWATVSNLSTAVTGADGTAIGTGLQNSIDIEAQAGNSAGDSAAVAARAYTGGSKSDWYLPSKDELNELCKFARTIPTGLPSEACPSSGGTQKTGFTWSPGDYWSSTEGSLSGYAFYQYFNAGNQGTTGKTADIYVRPIRAF